MRTVIVERMTISGMNIKPHRISLPAAPWDDITPKAEVPTRADSNTLPPRDVPPAPRPVVKPSPQVDPVQRATMEELIGRALANVARREGKEAKAPLTGRCDMREVLDLAKARREAVKALTARGLTVQDIAQRLGQPLWQIKKDLRLLATAAQRLPHKEAIAKRRARVAQLLAQGWTQGRIAEHLGGSVTTVEGDVRWIKKQAKANG
jgi:DNA-binding CsgD family transcriptional regulator